MEAADCVAVVPVTSGPRYADPSLLVVVRDRVGSQAAEAGTV